MDNLKEIEKEIDRKLKETNNKDSDSIKKINQEVEINNLPELPDFKNEKEQKEYEKKLKAKELQNRINKIVNKKEEILENRKKLEQKFLMKESFIEKIIKIIPFTDSNKIKIGIIDSSNNIKYYNKKIKTNTVTVKKKDYILMSDCVIRDKGKATIYYFEDIPYPIKFDRDKQKLLVTAEALHKLFQVKVVHELFSSGGLTKKQITVSIILVIVFGIIMALSVGFENLKSLGGTGNILLLLPKQLFKRKK